MTMEGSYFPSHDYFDAKSFKLRRVASDTALSAPRRSHSDVSPREGSTAPGIPPRSPHRTPSSSTKPADETLEVCVQTP